MSKVQLKEGVYWVGAIDWNLRNFHGYSTHMGTTYNAYLILDNKITLIDTVKAPFFDEMAARKASSRFSCADCGDTISDRMMWVDDGGFLCRHCAMLSRYRRMRGEGDRGGRRPSGLGYRGRFSRPL